MDISGLIIDCEERRFDDVVDALGGMPELEILRLVPPSRVVCLVEAADIDPSMAVSERIWAIPGVAAINLTCHYHGVEEEDVPQEEMALPDTNEVATDHKGLATRD
ncbi:MAG: chaperone NapD [Nitrospirota bacterium]|jgi:nitrate reductase NapAB chaperone NapD